MIVEDLITSYGILRPLNPEDCSELRLSLDAFEESSGLVLAPYLLDARFLDHLRDLCDGDADCPWSLLWALVSDNETIIGFVDFSEDIDRPGTFDIHWTVSPDWMESPFIREALRTLVDRAFDSKECRVLRTGRSFRQSPEMDLTFRSLGFRAVPGGEAGEYQLSKMVEGRLL
jgi:RimJ/RimL family protein N-acetyltransferase